MGAGNGEGVLLRAGQTSEVIIIGYLDVHREWKKQISKGSINEELTCFSEPIWMSKKHVLYKEED